MEFGLWLPVLFSLFAGLIDVSWMMSRYQNVVRAARDAARVGVAVVEDETSAPGAEITAAAEAHADALLTGVDMPCGDGCDIVTTFEASSGRLTVTINYPYEPILGFLPLGSTLQSSFTMQSKQDGG